MQAIDMKRNAVLTHAIVWVLVYIGWVLLFQGKAFTFSRTMTVQFCYLLFIAANFYLAVYYTVPRFLYKKKYLLFVLSLLGGILAGALLRVPLAMYLNRHLFLAGNAQPGWYAILRDSFINIFFWVVCSVSVWLMIEKIRFQRYLAAVEKEKSKNELDFLKAQFNPHFLFNSINSIYGHIEKGNGTARNMLLTFSEMLRYQLYECNTEKISIDKEVNYIRNYVTLQQTRKEASLVVNVDIDDSVKGFMIAPLLFIAFIENAFKYVSTYDTVENRVEVTMYRQDNDLVFRAMNTKDMHIRTLPESRGIGIANVKRRLELLYPGKHKLTINDEQCFYEVQLNLLV